MDVFTKLSMEIDGIKDNVRTYTSDGYINNILDKLKLSIEGRKVDETKYLLSKAIDWYVENQRAIQSNRHVLCKGQHKKNQETLISFLEELEQIKENPKSESNEKDILMKNFFISHSSNDKKVCTAFVKLLEKLGVPEEDILYTSSDRHGVPCDENIFDYLKRHIIDEITVFFMLSDNYYESAYCLNEMGAAWIVQNDFSTFLLPNFTGSINGVIDKDKKAYSLSSPMDLIELKDKIINQYNTSISPKKWEEVKNEFLKIVNE